MTSFLHSFIDTHLLDAIKTYHPHLYSVSIAEKKSDLSLFMATIVEKEIIGSKEKTYQWHYEIVLQTSAYPKKPYFKGFSLNGKMVYTLYVFSCPR